MSRVFWDSNLFIYLVEAHPVFGQQTQSLLRQHHRRKDRIVTSWLTVAEVQIKPKNSGNDVLCKKYREAIESSAEIVGFGGDAADKYVFIRTSTGVRGPDAIQLACAAAAGVELFITNDQRLHGLVVPGIHYIVPLDGVPL